VTINNLLPGKIDTDRQRAGMNWLAERSGRTLTEVEADQLKAIPAGRLGTPAEFGALCAFLCSVHAGYLTGQNIPVDGGLYTSAF